MVKNLPANGEDAGDLGLILGQEDPLEEEMATHFSILAWRIPWTEESGRLQSLGLQSLTRLSSGMCKGACAGYPGVPNITTSVLT